MRCGFAHQRWKELRLQNGLWLCAQCLDKYDRRFVNSGGFTASTEITVPTAPSWTTNDDWRNFTGITFDGTDDSFILNAAVPKLDIGTNDFVIEWVATIEHSGSPCQLIGAALVGTGVEILVQATILNCFISTNFSIHQAEIDVNLGSIVGDGLLHKYRLKGVRSGNMELFIDGVSRGTASMSDLIGQNITIPILVIGDTEPPSAGGNYKGNIYEIRWTVGNSTNNSGGPGETTAPYDYGSTTDSGVVAQWRFLESSGPIIDSVNGITLVSSSTTDATTPTYSVPGNLHKVTGGGSSIPLTWVDNSSNEDGFRIDKNGLSIANVGPGVTTYTVTGLSVSKIYYFRVGAFNAKGLAYGLNVPYEIVP